MGLLWLRLSLNRHVTESDLELSLLLPLSGAWGLQVYTAKPSLCSAVEEAQASSIPGEHSTSWTPFPALLLPPLLAEASVKTRLVPAFFSNTLDKEQAHTQFQRQSGVKAEVWITLSVLGIAHR